MRISERDKSEFKVYCHFATDQQLHNIFAKESAAGRKTYAMIALNEIKKRSQADEYRRYR